MGTHVKINGVEEVMKNLKKMPEKYQAAVMKAILKTAHVDVETKAKWKLTTDRHVDTGRLRASIHVQKKADTNFKYDVKRTRKKDGSLFLGGTFDGMLKTNIKPLSVIVGTNVEYAIKIERMDSYLFYALETSREKLRQRIKQNIEKVKP